MKSTSGNSRPSHRNGVRPAYLIVNADDFGYFDHVSDGILDCIDAGAVTATGVMTNSPAFANQAARLKERAQVDVGVHLTLTAGTPLTAAMADSLSKWGGRFPSKWSVIKAVLARHVSSQSVHAEWQRQIERCISMGLRPVFLNSHEHLHMLPSLYEQVEKLATEFGIRHVRRSLPESLSMSSPGALVRDAALWALASMSGSNRERVPPRLMGMGVSGKIDLAYVSTLLPKLEPGATYELMCHPGRVPVSASVPPNLLAYHSWEQERSTFISQQFKELLQAANVQLLRFSDLPA